jgi:Spy/CpxP family protein refolding chaperone
MLADLRSERDRIDRANNALSALNSQAGKPTPAIRTVRHKRRGLTPEGRKQLSEAVKKRWTERRKKRS